MNITDLLNFRVPEWIQYFVLAGIGLVVIAVPLRIIWAATRGLRKHNDKMDEFADRLRERFNEVQVKRSIIGPTCVHFKHESRKASVTVHGDQDIVVRLDESISPKFPVVVKTQRKLLFPWAFVGLRVLPRIRTFDALVDDAVAIYAEGAFANYLRDVLNNSITREGKASGLSESLTVLRRLSGVRKFRLSAAPEGAIAVRLVLRTQDLFFRPDELESVVHHLGVVYDHFVKY